MYRPAVNSMLLASTRPDRLGDWYAAAFEPGSATTMNGYRILRFGTFHLLVDRRGDIGDTTPEPGRVIVNIDVDDARAVVARMDAMGVEWLAELEDRDGSLFATAIDPAGSYVQLVQLHPGHGPRAEDGDGALLGSAAFSGFAVDDLDAAETFYRDTLGVPVRRHDGLLDLQLPGDRDVLVHPRPDHAPAAFTILNFPVPDIDRAVDELGARASSWCAIPASTTTNGASCEEASASRSPGSRTPPATSCPSSRCPDGRWRRLAASPRVSSLPTHG